MPSTFFHPLTAESLSLLSSDLVVLQQAARAKFSIVDTFISQPTSFSRLVEESKLFDAFTGDESKDPALQAKLLKKMLGMSLTRDLVQELHQLYHQKMGGSYVRMHSWTQFGRTAWISEIKGDANIAESLLAAWVSAAELNFQHGASWVEAVMNCRVVIQSQPAKPVACGEIFTRHPESGERHLMVVRLWPGAPHAALRNDSPTQYAIDIRTGMIVQRQVGLSTSRAKRQPDRIVLEDLSETAEFLDEKEILMLVRQVTNFKRQFSHNIHAKFEIADDALLITSIKVQQDEVVLARRTHQILTKVYVATGDAEQLDLTAHENSDGIGLLRGEYVFSRLEHHPMTLLKRGRSAFISERLATFFNEAAQSYPDRRILYRLQNFTSQELSMLHSGDTQEKEEPNPYLGWRGGLRLIEQSELFEPELTAFGKWLKRRHAPTGLIVPFVRSASEWRWIINRWNERKFFDHPEFETWFQITTPENISNLETYVLPQVRGVTLNLRTITALMTGVDPDDDQLQSSYPPPIELQLSVLSEVQMRMAHLRKESRHAKLQLHLHLEDFNHALVTSAVKLRYDGIVLHPAALTIGRSCIGAAEQELLLESSKSH